VIDLLRHRLLLAPRKCEENETLRMQACRCPMVLLRCWVSFQCGKSGSSNFVDHRDGPNNLSSTGWVLTKFKLARRLDADYSRTRSFGFTRVPYKGPSQDRYLGYVTDYCQSQLYLVFTRKHSKIEEDFLDTNLVLPFTLLSHLVCWTPETP
jgi:hypothetical protein